MSLQEKRLLSIFFYWKHPDVGPLVDGFAFGLFGAHVCGCPKNNDPSRADGREDFVGAEFGAGS
jgi:hypothetical protein